MIEYHNAIPLIGKSWFQLLNHFYVFPTLSLGWALAIYTYSNLDAADDSVRKPATHSERIMLDLLLFEFADWCYRPTSNDQTMKY